MIYVLWPTCRPEKAAQAKRLWDERTLRPSSCLFVFGVSPSMRDEMLCRMIALNGMANNYAVSETTETPGVTASATILTRKWLKVADVPFDDKDIFVLASDDFQPPQNWDRFLEEQFANFDGMLIADDRPANNIIAIPICSGACLKKLNGIVYHPSYSHFFSDQELFYVCESLGLLKDLRKSGGGLIEPFEAFAFHHKHWSFGGRDRDHFDQRNSDNWDRDKKTYELRKDWPVEKRLELPEGWEDGK